MKTIERTVIIDGKEYDLVPKTHKPHINVSIPMECMPILKSLLDYNISHVTFRDANGYNGTDINGIEYSTLNALDLFIMLKSSVGTFNTKE